MRHSTAVLLEQAAILANVDITLEESYRGRGSDRPSAALVLDRETDLAAAALLLGETLAGRPERDTVLADLRAARVDSLGRQVVVY